MLRTLRVRDLAIIEELELWFEPGLNVLTGETGAGKSILLQALDVALGGRADADLVRTGADEAIVEAMFSHLSPGAREVLTSAGIAGDGVDEVLIRRVIARGGRTRTTINTALGSQPILHELAPHLLRVYGQDEHHALRRIESHRELLDGIGGLGTSLAEMSQRFQRLVVARQALATRKAARAEIAEKLELYQFQAAELERAGLTPGEEERLAGERLRLMHAEKLNDLIGGAESGLYSGEGAAVDVTARALVAIKEAERVDPGLGPIRALVETALTELNEASAELGRYGRNLTPDPERLDRLETRLAELARLKRKYGGSIEELIRHRDELAAELGRMGEGEDALIVLENDLSQADRAAHEWAKRLSVERRRIAHDVERSLSAELVSLAMGGARFGVKFGDPETRPIGPDGFDDIEFLLSANPGEALRPLSRVASGGELSRIMLALKALAAGDEHDASLIFDEVDTGIGGAVAEVVAKKLRQLGRRRQVLCVTHLPVVAAFAQHHIGVMKKVVAGRTVSSARPLAPRDRVAELARMLGGARVSREAEEHAEQLLRQAEGRTRRATGAAT